MLSFWKKRKMDAQDLNLKFSSNSSEFSSGFETIIVWSRGEESFFFEIVVWSKWQSRAVKKDQKLIYGDFDVKSYLCGRKKKSS